VESLILKILTKSLGTYKKRLAEFDAEKSLKSAHDFRVALRRLLVSLEFARESGALDLRDETIEAIKGALKNCGELSDVLTSEKITDGLIEKHPRLSLFKSYIEAKGRTVVEKMDADFKPPDISELEEKFAALRAEKLETAETAQRNLAAVFYLEKKIKRETAGLMKAFNKNDADRIESVHALRVKIRRARYFIELLAAAAGDAVKPGLEAAKTLQTLMGDAHDNAIFLRNFEEFLSLSNDPKGKFAAFKRSFARSCKTALKRLAASSPRLIETLSRPPLSNKKGSKKMKPFDGIQIVLLRHATAVDRFSAGIDDDANRPLTREGRKEAKRAAKKFKSLGLEFDRVMTSPLLRALETAKIAVKQMKIEDKLEIVNELAAEADSQELAASLSSLKPGTRVLLIGHEPYFSRLASFLITGDYNANIGLKKGGAIALSMEEAKLSARARLDWMLNQDQME